MHSRKRNKFPLSAYTIAAFFNLLGLISACTLSPRNFHAVENKASATFVPLDSPTSSADPIDVTVAPSPSPLPSPTLSPTSVVLIPTRTATSLPVQTSAPTLANPVVEGWVIGGGVNLREGPGQLFPILQVLPYHAAVGIITASPGRQWLQVRTEAGITGWMMAQYIQTSLAVEAISQVLVSQDWITLKGSVKDSVGRPLVGADVLLYDAQGRRAVTRSWEDSYFYLLLPKNTQGRWTLRVLRPVCSSASINPQCPGPGYFIDNPRVLEILGDQSVELVYQLH